MARRLALGIAETPREFARPQLLERLPGPCRANSRLREADDFAALLVRFGIVRCNHDKGLSPFRRGYSA